MLRTQLRLNQLHLDWKAVTVIILSTLILSFNYYRVISHIFYVNMLIYYLAFPLFIILVVLRESPGRYGFKLGDWKAGLALTAVGILFISLIIPFIAPMKEFHAYYARLQTNTLALLVNKLLELVGWEFFFRGFLFFALYRIVGPYAIFLQAVPFTMMHFGKPELETLSCIFGGSLFGYVSWRTSSFLYAFLIHTYLSVLVILLA